MRLRGNRRILVGRIFTELDAAIVEKRAHIGAPCLQERAHDDSRSRMHPAKASRTGPSQQPQKERLSLIVFRVRHGDDGRVKADEGAAKEVVARGVRGVLDRNAVPGGCFLDVDALDVGRDRQTRAQVAAERLVAIGFRAAQLVVQMDRAGHMKIVAGNLPQYQQQTHRIGAAGQRHGDTAAGREQSVATNRTAGRVEDIHRCVGCEQVRPVRGCEGARRERDRLHLRT